MLLFDAVCEKSIDLQIEFLFDGADSGVAD
jgi:hypothetical protein